jgi:hypothetical protein
MAHLGNKLGCYIKPDGDHVALMPVTLKLWAVNLKDGQPGITERNPPPNHLFDNVVRKTKARVSFFTPLDTSKPPVQSSLDLTNVHAGTAVQPWTLPSMPQVQPNFYGNTGFSPVFYSAYPSPPTGFSDPGVPGVLPMGIPPAQNTQLIPPLRQELLQLPLGLFLSRLEELYPAYAFLPFQEELEGNGITPDLIPSMSDADLDSIFGKNSIGKRIVLRRLLGRDSVG